MIFFELKFVVASNDLTPVVSAKSSEAAVKTGRLAAFVHLIAE